MLECGPALDCKLLVLSSHDEKGKGSLWGSFIYLFIYFQKKVFYVDLFFFFVFIEFTASFLFYVLVSFGQEACGMPYLSN